MKVEGKGYQRFMSEFLEPFFSDKLQSVPPGKIEKYNKDVIAALSGKRKAVSRPTRSVKYKAMAKLPCSKCEISFPNNSQSNKHRRAMHTRGKNDSIGSSRNMPTVDDLSLLDISDEENKEEESSKAVSLEENSPEVKINSESQAAVNVKSTREEEENQVKTEASKSLASVEIKQKEEVIT